MIAMTLPWPPSVNHLYGNNGRGGRYLKSAGVQFKAHVAGLVADAGYQTIMGPVMLYVVAFMPDRRKRDLDNTLKILCDSLTEAGVYEDDSLIDMLLIERHKERIKGGMLKILVMAINE